jgi:hypothetical protein
MLLSDDLATRGETTEEGDKISFASDNTCTTMFDRMFIHFIK